VSPRRPEEVCPEPDDVRRQPADGEDGNDADDESRHSLLRHNRLTLRWSAVSGRLRRPKSNDSQRAQSPNRRHRNGVVDHEQNQKAGGTMPAERCPVVGADGELREAGQLVLADGVDGDPRRGEQQRRRPDADDDGQGSRRPTQVLRPQRVPDRQKPVE